MYGVEVKVKNTNNGRTSIFVTDGPSRAYPYNRPESHDVCHKLLVRAYIVLVHTSAGVTPTSQNELINGLIICL